MIRKFLFYTLFTFYSFFTIKATFAQTCLPTNINSTIVNIDCNNACAKLLFKIPHLKSTNDYVVTSIPYKPFDYVTIGGTEDINLYDDDQYSDAISLPFTFCFYDSSYNKVVVGSNGVISFDIANAGCENAFEVNPPIPYKEGNICNQFSTYYPKAAIMGAFSDFDPGPGPNNISNASPSDKKIQWRVEGTAPCRKFVVSYYHIGTFGVNSCGRATPNDFQIVIYESTGLIDIFIGNKTCRSSTNDSKSIMGIQNWFRDKAVAPVGKNAAVWDVIKEGYRFTPNGNTTRFVSAELLTLAGVLISKADTATTEVGILDIAFKDICPQPGTNNKYLVKTTFSSCINGGSLLVAFDTVFVNRAIPDTCFGTVNNASCVPDSKGSITITRPLGASMQYSINAGNTFQSSPLFNLAPGNYTVTAKNTTTNCLSTASFSISSLSTLNATAAITDAACAGSASGNIAVNATLGTPPYTYSIDGGIFQSNNIFDKIIEGSHSIIVKDFIGCIFSFSVRVPSGAGITATSGIVNPQCKSGSNGSITINPSSGKLPYAYSINGGIFQASNVFSNLSAAKYIVVAKDENGCAVTIDATVLDGIAISTTSTSINANCAGSSSGSITVTTPLSGVVPFTYSLNGGLFQSSNLFSSLAGVVDYIVTVSDANGCKTSFLQNVGNNTGINASLSLFNAACLGSATGKIIVTIIEGKAPFSYSLDSVNFQSNNTFENLVAKTYKVFIKDANSCSLSLSAIVTNDLGANAVISSINAACLGSVTGAIIINPSAGTAPFVYSNDNAVNFQTSNTFRNLLSNAYNIVVRDANNCIFRASTQVVNNPGVTAFTIIDDASCSIVPNGKISVSPTAGIPPFSYSIDAINFQSSNQFSNLFSGKFIITIIDSASCKTTKNITVGNAPRVVLDSLIITKPSCKGFSNGVIAVYPRLGIPPYQYALNSGSFKISNVFTNIAANTSDTVHIRDNSGCIKDTIITISEPSLLGIATTAEFATCSGNPDGKINVIASGGTTPYSYSKNPNSISDFQPSSSFQLLVGNYKITVKDAKGCTASVLDTVLLNDTMRLQLVDNATFCEGVGTVLLPQTNNQTNTFIWTPSKGLSESSIKNPLATPSDTTKYYLTAKWGICTRFDSITLNILLKPKANAGKDTAVCFKTPAFLNGSISKTSGPVTFAWSPTQFLSNPDNLSTSLLTDTNGVYNYIFTVKDNYGCNLSNSDTVNVIVQPMVPAFAGKDTTAVIAGAIPHKLLATGGGLGGSYQWSWFPTDGVVISNPLSANPTVLLNNHNYEFTVKVTDFAGCIGYDKIKITAYIGPNYYVPTAFSPNGDGQNEIFRPIPVGISSTEYFRIINRYGELIFQTNQFMAGWDGTYKGKPVPVGAYVWIIKGKDRKGLVIEKKGTVVLIR